MNDQYEHIEKYLKGELNDSQRQAFEQEIQEDQTLAERVGFYKNSMKGISEGLKEEKEVEELRKTLDALNSKYFPEEEKRTRPLWVWMSSAAAVITLLIGFYFGFLRPPLHERLYETYEQHPNLPVTMSGSGSEDIIKGIEFYNQGNFSEALPLLEISFQELPEDFRLLNAIGICQLELDKFDQAEEAFGKLTQSSDIFKDQGKWNLALVNLKKGEIDICKAKLEELASQEGSFQKQAARLLEEF